MKQKSEVVGKVEMSKLKTLLSKYTHPSHVNWMRTGIHAIDLAIGGGIPLGRVIEIFGSESAGKSLLAWTILRAFQNVGGVIVVFDVEATVPTKFMTDLGINTEEIIYELPETVEDVEESMVRIVTAIRELDKVVPIAIVWDSIAATSARGEWEKDKETGQMVPKEHDMARRAAAMSNFFKHRTLYMSNNNVTLIAVNQLRDKIGVLFGRKTDSPGGHALKHHASVRIELTRGKKFEVGDQIAGVDCYMTIQKNKVAPPFRKTTCRIDWNRGFNAFAGLDEILEMSGRIKTKSAGRYVCGEEEFLKKDLADFIASHPQLLDPYL